MKVFALTQTGFLLLVIFLCFSCDIFKDPGINPNGNLEFTIVIKEYKAVQPGIDMKQDLSRIIGKGPENSSFSVETETNQVEIPEIKAGDWNIVVEVKNKDNTIIYMGKTKVTVKRNETVKKTCDVFPLDGEGILDLNVTWKPGEISPLTAKGVITSMQGGPFLLELEAGPGNSVYYRKEDIATGFYTLTVTLSSGENHIIGKTDVVRIIKDQETSLRIDFLDLSESPEDEDKDNDKDSPDSIQVEITGVRHVICNPDLINADAEVKGQIQDLSYQWYINGIALPGQTKAGIHLSPPLCRTGYNFLSVIVLAKKEGKIGAAICRFIVRDYYDLPAGAKSSDPDEYELLDWCTLHSLSLENNGQVITVDPEEQVTGECTYQVYSPGDLANRVNGFFLLSWIPAEETDIIRYTIPVYSGIPGTSPGIGIRQRSICFKAPSEPGIYYLYFCSATGVPDYFMPEAVKSYSNRLKTPAHAKIIVRNVAPNVPELFDLPAWAKNRAPDDKYPPYSYEISSIDLGGFPREITVPPGKEIKGACTFNIFSDGSPYNILQGFFIASWTPSWPPAYPSEYVIPLYNNIPGNFPGPDNIITCFKVKAPLIPGEYYLYWCGGVSGNITDAVQRYVNPLKIPAHAKITVRNDVPDIASWKTLHKGLYFPQLSFSQIRFEIETPDGDNLLHLYIEPVEEEYARDLTISLDGNILHSGIISSAIRGYLTFKTSRGIHNLVIQIASGSYRKYGWRLNEFALAYGSLNALWFPRAETGRLIFDADMGGTASVKIAIEQGDDTNSRLFSCRVDDTEVIPGTGLPWSSEKIFEAGAYPVMETHKFMLRIEQNDPAPVEWGWKLLLDPEYGLILE
ncbi:MAG: hypothetical protein JXB88_24245 [Spirochaetales bacterium]|nr:hypothetical protein [Spirochaetales bacterium]